jgi:hypothetical protein
MTVVNSPDNLFSVHDHGRWMASWKFKQENNYNEQEENSFAGWLGDGQALYLYRANFDFLSLKDSADTTLAQIPSADIETIATKIGPYGSQQRILIGLRGNWARAFVLLSSVSDRLSQRFGADKVRLEDGRLKLETPGLLFESRIWPQTFAKAARKAMTGRPVSGTWACGCASGSAAGRLKIFCSITASTT